MSSPALTLTGLACRRGGRLLFEALDLALGPGQAALVTGANGAGKSSLLRIIAGLLPPTAGTVSAQGAIGWLGEAAALDPRLALARALGFWARIDGRPNVLWHVDAAHTRGLATHPGAYERHVLGLFGRALLGR